MGGKFREFFGWGVRTTGEAVVSVFFWTLWTVLVALLLGQAYIASTNELPVPRFVQQALEKRLAASGIKANFGRTIFDPSGRVLIENVRITLKGFEEPVVTARAVYARLDPWALVTGRFEPVELRVTGVSLRVPAMLSPSGQSDEIVADLDAAFLPRGADLTIEYLNCHLGNLAVSAEGTVHLSSPHAQEQPALPIAQFLASSYGSMSREGAVILEHFGVLDHPSLNLQLSADQKRGAHARYTLEARAMKLNSPVAFEATNVVGQGEYSPSTDAPLPTELVLTADRASLPGFASELVDVRLRVRGVLPAGEMIQPGKAPITISDICMSASKYSSGTLTLVSPIFVARGEKGLPLTDFATTVPKPFQAVLQAYVFGQVCSIDAGLDLGNKAADVTFSGAAASGVLTALSNKTGKNLDSLIGLEEPLFVTGSARFNAGWKFDRVRARVEAHGFGYRGVKTDELRGLILFDGHTLYAQEAFARIGSDYARGSFQWDLSTHNNRYLLDGRLRPLDITPWIGAGTQPFWKTFFGDLQFPGEPALASMDLRSNFTSGRKLEMFIAVDSKGATYRGVGLDRLHTRLFVRPQWVDALEFSLAKGTASAEGKGSYSHDPDVQGFGRLDFALTSNLALDDIVAGAGPLAAPLFSAYHFDKPPAITASGWVSGEADRDGPHQKLLVEAHSDSLFQYHDFPFDGISLKVKIDDGDITLSDVAGGFAGGAVAGHGQVTGKGDQQRLEVQGSLTGANLAQSITKVEAWKALRDKKPPPPTREFLADKADVKLDVSLSARGLLADSTSFEGTGNASLRGTDLLQLKMMGLLSDLLQFTNLRFTSANAEFKLSKATIFFPKIDVIGANSGIAASGNYVLTTHQLDFRARVNPFQESKTVPQKFMGLVLTPLSSALEVKLLGDVEKPHWVFANGPTNFFRSLAQPAADKPAASPAPLREH